MTIYFDRQGDAITKYQWQNYMANKQYRTIKKEKILDLRIVCEWLGIANPYFNDPEGILFRTYVKRKFDDGSVQYIVQKYFSTEEQAFQHHKVMREFVLYENAV